MKRNEKDPDFVLVIIQTAEFCKDWIWWKMYQQCQTIKHCSNPFEKEMQNQS